MTFPDPSVKRLQERVFACYQQAELFYERAFPRPQISWQLRGRAAGKAFLQRNELRFNPKLYRANQEPFLGEVVPHEVAHLLVYQLYGAGTKPHGKEWRTVMVQLFCLAPKVTHSFDLAPLNETTVLYRCGCGEHPLSLRRHNKIVRGEASYRCRQCLQPLVQA